MWLEIENDVVIGVHSDKSTRDCLWIDYDGDAKPGDIWKNDRLVPGQKDINDVDQKRIAARSHIIKFYPIWKQINILRLSDQREISKMGLFIDATRNWSNKPGSRLSSLEKISP